MTETLFAKTHEWATFDGDSVTIGITEFAVEQLGDVVYVDFSQLLDREVNAGDAIGEIESVKAVSQIYTPVSGSVSSVNAELTDNPQLVNQSPMDAGWMIKVSKSNPSDRERLMSAEEYAVFIAEEPH